MRITDLKVNNLVFPVGIDTVPTFRWINDMPGYGRAQSAYRITVASTAKKAEAQEGDLWDSGKVENTLNYDISYGGATYLTLAGQLQGSDVQYVTIFLNGTEMSPNSTVSTPLDVKKAQETVIS